jgi:gluconokinase
MIVVLMGVSGAGKTTIGKLLASDLKWSFYEGDDFHPRANIAKMAAGIPLTDEDRIPWLDAIQTLIRELSEKAESAIVTCSALKQSYRDRVRIAPRVPRFVFLLGSYELIKDRVQKRVHPFMNPSLLKSQLETLEEPEDALIVDASDTPAEIVKLIKQGLALT